MSGAPASEAENCRYSKAELYQQSQLSVPGVQDQLNGPGSFCDFTAFWTSSSTPKVGPAPGFSFLKFMLVESSAVESDLSDRA